MPRFIAIPVAQGDAFYLEREGFSLLVDGGRSRSALPSMFQVATKTDGVTVVLCTHNDADHANGILGFLESGLRCEEVWLPGRWLGVLPDVLKPFVEVFLKLERDIAEMGIPSNMETAQPSSSLIEVYAEREGDRLTDVPATGEGPPIARNGWPKSYVQMLERAEPWDFPPHWLGLWGPKDWPFWLYCAYPRLEPTGVQLLWSAIDAAARIRTIAIEAFHRGIPVRWFEFDTSTPSGGVPELQPINGRKIARVRPRVGPLLASLALTVSNKESLVFWSPATEHHPGVLFAADSDLSNLQLPRPLTDAIATAPHHGSEANAKAYAAVSAAAQQHSPSITWVRSDGRYRSRPGPTYRSLLSPRFCTLCRGVSFAKQAVHLSAQAGLWTPHGTRPCQCL